MLPIRETKLFRIAERILSATQKPLAILLAVLGGVAAIASVVVWLAGKSEYDLVFWIKSDTAVYPSRETNDLPLSLTFEGQAADSVTICDISIGNLGKQSIGDQNALWSATIEVDPPARIVVREQVTPRVRPARTRLQLPIKQQSPSSLLLQIGMLEPNAEVSFQVLVVDAQRAAAPKIRFDTDLKGLPEPLRTRSHLKERLAEKVLPWVWSLVVLAAILWGIVLPAYGKQRRGLRPVLKSEMRTDSVPKFIGMLALLAGATLIIAYAVSRVFGQLATWVLVLS